jgi:F-type H+-transporting ATPase subunit b
LTARPFFPARFIPLGFLVLLAGFVAVGPTRSTAQEPSPSKTSGPTAEESAKAKAVGKEEEEKQHQAFRQEGPMVQATSKMLHLSPGVTASIYEVINFAIIALALGIPLFRFLPKFLRQRAEKLSGDLESARKVTEDANTRLSAVEAKLAHLDEEIAKFRAEVEAEVRQDEARIKASIEEESVRIVASAEQEIGVAAAQARRGLRHFAADLAIEQAGKQMVLTAETDRALIAEFVNDVAANGARGGRN